MSTHYDKVMAAGMTLNIILNSSDSIKNHADEIATMWETVYDELNSEEITELSSRIKSKVQLEAEEAFVANNWWGSEFMATGSGKSKIAVNLSARLVREIPKANILISVPTEKLRDENWMNEFAKWEQSYIWENNVQRCCYASLSKYENEHFDFVILDEGHNITELNSEFFKKNKVDRCLLLTATRPKDFTKLQILRELKLVSVYELSLDIAVKLGLVAPYDITIITTHLDNIDKYIPAGSKAKPFMNTEKAHYGYLSRMLTAYPNQMGFIKRMQFIYNLKSKTEAAGWILNNIIPEGLRTIIFCGSRDQANKLCEHRFYSKPQPPKKLTGDKITPKKLEKYRLDYEKYELMLKEFQGDVSYFKFAHEEISRMSCVEAMNEGENINNLDVGFIVQLNSNEKDLIQRMGRLLRFRPGHRGKILILCVFDSADKDWGKKATANLNPDNIRFVELSHLKMGIETILFN